MITELNSIGQIATCLIFALLTACTLQSEDGPLTALNTANLETHVRILAGDAFEGRGAGYLGEQDAAAYIAKSFADIGLAPIGDNGEAGRTYYQSFEFSPYSPETPWQLLKTQNVIAILPGSDLADEVIVLGAHHDGQGMAGQANAGRFVREDGAKWEDNIWNSASDNATSVAAVLEIARVLAASDRPLRRTIVFVTFSAEEYALNGAIEYVGRPPVAWARHVAMINLEKLVGDPEIDFITATSGSSPAFDDITTEAAMKSGVEIKPFFPGLVTDTDHYPFVARGVPAIVIGTGSYRHIHEPGDEPDRLDYKLLKDRVNYILEFLVAAANREGEFEFTGDASGYYGVLGCPPTKAELQLRNLDAEMAALKVTALIPGMSGDRAGIRVGDLITAVNGDVLAISENGYFTLAEIIGNRTSGDLYVTAVRADGEVELRVSLGQ